MEQHFDTNETKYQCYDFWENSKSFNDLFTYEKCTRFALGDGSYFCAGRVKVIRKGNWAWARDGWITQSLSAPGDFMFHGWKLSKLGNEWFWFFGAEWIWPFKTPVFDASICSPGSSFRSFALNEKLVKTDEEIMKKLKAIKEETRKGYIYQTWKNLS